MPNNVRYNSMQQTQQQQAQTNLYNYQQQQQQHRHHHHHHHHSHNTSPTPSVIPNASSYSNHRLTTTNTTSNNNNINQTHVASPLLSSNQSSAYFLDRIDLENYTTQTLKQTVETILSKTKSKGLKVKIALPDEGLIIHNITDPSQSWIFKTAELLYFWRDPYYLNIIVVITTNRSRRQSNRPYSAAVFRLRGTDSAQLFLQQARQFFSNLSASSNNSNVTKFNRNKSVESLNRIPNRTNDSNKLSIYKPKSKTLSSINDRTSSSAPKTIPDNQHHRHHHHHHQSSQATPTTTTTNTTTAIRRVTRAEFDPGKNPTTTSSTDNTSNRRTYSETASSTDSHTINSIKELTSYTKKSDDDDDDDDKLTITSNNFSNEQVAELVRELKELRNEIASLKLSSNTTLSTQSESSKPTNDSSIRTSSPTPQDATSQSEVDAETQTDFSVTNHRRRATSKKNKKTMIGTGGVSSVTSKKKPSQSKTRNGRRTFSNSSTNTLSEQEETTSDISSQANDSTNDTNIVRMPEQQQQQQQSFLLGAPPRPVILKIQNNLSPPTNSTSYPFISHTNSIEEGSLSSGLPVTIEKETSKFLSTNNSSSNSDTSTHSGSKILPAGVSNFRSTLENSNSPAEHIYENVPILIQPNSNRDAYYNIPIINADDPQQQQNQSDGHNYYPTNNRESESQQQYSLNGQTLSSSPPTTDNTNSSEGQVSLGNIQQQQKPQIVSAGRHRNQPIYFANHLTNPVFNVDKQLLINTVANQFGVDLNSPQLQQLITNQHLFVARKRTFANMVWQLTPDEETALCSPPTSTRTSIIDIDTIDSNNSTARSILKAKKRLNSTSKRRGISWDSTLE